MQLPRRGFRIARRRYADLSGEGARLVGGRWNSPGRAAVYLTEEPALAVLEVLVHLDLPSDLMPRDFVLMEVTFDLPAGAGENWLSRGPQAVPVDAECRTVGDAFLGDSGALALRVPSVLVPYTGNLVLNPLHPLARHVAITNVSDFTFDRRLLR